MNQEETEKRYSIGDVSRILNVKEHTIRFWEKEFAFLRPSKNKSGRRSYGIEDIKLLQKIKKLLYDEQYTIKGAKKELEKNFSLKQENIEIQTISQQNKEINKEIENKKQTLSHFNPQSLAKNQTTQHDENFYRKINKEILSRIHAEIEELLEIWQEFPDEEL